MAVTFSSSLNLSPTRPPLCLRIVPSTAASYSWLGAVHSTVASPCFCLEYASTASSPQSCLRVCHCHHSTLFLPRGCALVDTPSSRSNWDWVDWFWWFWFEFYFELRLHCSLIWLDCLLLLICYYVGWIMDCPQNYTQTSDNSSWRMMRWLNCSWRIIRWLENDGFVSF